MFTNMKIALAAALILGAASAALANDIDVNPSSAQSAREWAEYLGQNQKHTDNARTSYGYFASPSQQEDFSQSRNKSHNH
jgi:opacity protein-like surface antigen